MQNFLKHKTIASFTKLFACPKPLAHTRPVTNKQPLASKIVVSALLVTLMGCQSNPFTKQAPEPEPRYVPNIALGEPQELTILPYKVPCNSALPMLCMVARQASGAMFQIPYSWVEGFRHSNGVQYQVVVRPEIDTKKTAQDGQPLTGHWVLDQVISQQAAP